VATDSSRRRFITTTAWTVPALVVVTATPALAMSARGISVLFNQPVAGSDGYLQQSYLNLGMQPGTSAYTLPASMTVYFQVVGLNTRTVDERSFTASSSDGTVRKLAYDPTIRTTRFSWVIPAGTRIPSLSTTNPGDSAYPDVAFYWRDGLTSNGRITSKVVVTGISGPTSSLPLTGYGNRQAGPASAPIDSAVVGDLSTGNGIY